MTVAVSKTTFVEPGAGAAAAPPLLQVRDLKVHFGIGSGWLRRETGAVRAVDGVSFEIFQGGTLGLVGESGCGKSTTGRAIVRLLAPTDGELIYNGGAGGAVDLARLSRHDLRPYRRDIRMIFQDPYSSLNPRMTVAALVGEPLVVNGIARGSELEDRVALLLRRVGLRPEYMRRYPHAFSGGERQRIGIARALATDPKLVICDEAVSALDVSVQAQTLNLLRDLQEELNLTYLFVAHDLSVVEHISDRVAVMYVGRMVEVGPVEQLFRRPRHPYTEALLSAVPLPNPRLRGKSERIRLTGDVADPANPPSGCHFHPRCRYAQDVCRTTDPPMVPTPGGGHAACHFADSLQLRGIPDDKPTRLPPLPPKRVSTPTRTIS